MKYEEKRKKLNTLPWQALFDIAVKKGIAEKEVKSKDKDTVINIIISYGILEEDEIDELVNEYIYGDRITFTLWNFKNKLTSDDYKKIKEIENGIYKEICISKFRILELLRLKNIRID